MTDEEFSIVMKEKGYPDNVIESTKSLIREEAGGIDNFMPVPKVLGMNKETKKPIIGVGYSTTNGNSAWGDFDLGKRNFKEKPLSQAEAIDLMLYNFTNPVTRWDLKAAGNVDPERLKSVMSLGYLADPKYATPVFKALLEGKTPPPVPMLEHFTKPAEKDRWAKHTKVVSGEAAGDYLVSQMPKPTNKIEDFGKDALWEEIFPAQEQQQGPTRTRDSSANQNRFLLEMEKQLGISPRSPADNTFNPQKELDSLYLEKFKRRK